MDGRCGLQRELQEKFILAFIREWNRYILPEHRGTKCEETALEKIKYPEKTLAYALEDAGGEEAFYAILRIATGLSPPPDPARTSRSYALQLGRLTYCITQDMTRAQEWKFMRAFMVFRQAPNQPIVFPIWQPALQTSPYDPLINEAFTEQCVWLIETMPVHLRHYVHAGDETRCALWSMTAGWLDGQRLPVDPFVVQFDINRVHNLDLRIEQRMQALGVVMSRLGLAAKHKVPDIVRAYAQMLECGAMLLDVWKTSGISRIDHADNIGDARRLMKDVGIKFFDRLARVVRLPEYRTWCLVQRDQCTNHVTDQPLYTVFGIGYQQPPNDHNRLGAMIRVCRDMCILQEPLRSAHVLRAMQVVLCVVHGGEEPRDFPDPVFEDDSLVTSLQNPGVEEPHLMNY